MAYLGRQPLVGNYTVLDALTATATDTYALTKNSVAVFPQTPANCIVSLNGVIQAPFSSYNISGSNIVFASALTASDSIDFITVLGDVLNVGTVSDGTIGLAKLSATGTKDATTFLRGDNTFASAGGTNTPNFSVYRSSNQTIANATTTTVIYNTKLFDTASAYNTSTGEFTVPSGQAGKYFFTAQVQWNTLADFDLTLIDIAKNGTRAVYGDINPNRYYNTISVNLLLELAVSDVVTIRVAQESGGSIDINGESYRCYFTGFKIIE